MENKPVIYIVNSIIDKPGNIGFRIGKLINPEDIVVSRFWRSSNNSSNINMGWFHVIPRGFNAIKIYIISMFRHRYYDKMFFELFFYFRKNKIISIANNSSVVHLMEFSPSIISYFKSRGYKVILDVPIGPSKYLIELSNILGVNSRSIGATYMKDYEEEAFLLADHIVVPSDFVRNELVKCGVVESKLSIIPFGVDIKKGSLKKNFDLNCPINYVFAGVICKRKGIDYLLEAWSRPEFKHDKLHLCGRIDPEYKSIIKEKGFTNIITPGFVDTQEYFKNCDVYVFPSLLEGSSKSIYEAMNSSLPVITTYESGSIVQDGVSGFLVPKCNSEILANKMLEMKNITIRKSMATSAFELVQEYTWDKYKSRIEKLHNNIGCL